MIKNSYPLFQTGAILTKEMLDLLRDNSMEAINLVFSENKDGIVSGFNLVTDSEKKEVVITPGILKKNGKIFWMKKKTSFSMPNEEDKYIAKIKFNYFTEEKKYYIRTGDLIIEAGNEVGENELELARFITRVGAELRNDYPSFKDLRRDFNLLEVINVRFSSRHELGTLHPVILSHFGKEAAEKEKLDMFDIDFYNSCLRNSAERDNIISYINRKTFKAKYDYTNYELYEELLDILENMGPNRSLAQKRRFIPEKIVVD